MSSSFFNDAFDQYESQMSEYRANVNNLKDTLLLAKENRLEAAKQLGLELAAPYLAHASLDGIRSLLSDKLGTMLPKSATRPVAPSDVTSVATPDTTLATPSVANLQSAAAGAVETARTNVATATQPATPSQAGLTMAEREQRFNDLTLQNQAKWDREQQQLQAQRGGQAEDVPSELAAPPQATALQSNEIEPEPESELLNTLAERNTVSYGPMTEADDFVSGLDSIASVPGAASQELRMNQLADFFKPRDPVGTSGGTAVRRPTVDTEFNDEMLNDPRTLLQGGGIRPPPAQPAAEADVATFVEPEAGQASTNVIGRMFSGLKQAGQDALDQATSRLTQAVQSNVQSVQRATGATQEVAEQAIQGGDQAIQGGTRLLPTVAADVAEGGAAATEATEGALAATEIATEGPIGLIEAGLTVGIGELINKISDRARRSIPAAIPLPQLAIPSFQPGASFGGY